MITQDLLTFDTVDVTIKDRVAVDKSQRTFDQDLPLYSPGRLVTHPADTPNDPLSWLADAACHDRSIGDFFIPAGHNLNPEISALCRACPVRVQCLTHGYANARAAGSGAFGGFSPTRRQKTPFVQALQEVAEEADADYVKAKTARDTTAAAVAAATAARARAVAAKTEN